MDGAWGSEMVEELPTMVVEDRQRAESERGCCWIWPQELPATSKHVYSLVWGQGIGWGHPCF